MLVPTLVSRIGIQSREFSFYIYPERRGRLLSMILCIHFRSARLPTTNRDGTKTGASNGGVWEWCSTEFAAYEGWRTSELYPGYSEDFFDGCHWIMLGGSFGKYLSN